MSGSVDIISLISIVLITSSLGALLAQNRSWRAQQGKDLPGQKGPPAELQQPKLIRVLYINKSGGHTCYYDGPDEIQAKQGWYRALIRLGSSGGFVEFSVDGVVRDRRSNV